jgi:hypothetical protein
VRIAEARTQLDLSIRWSWASTTRNIGETTFYEIHVATFLMLTFTYDKGYKEVINPLFNRFIETYRQP